MFVDALTAFVQPGAPLSLVAGAGVAVASNVYDILGVGVGNAPPAIIGTPTLFGSDMGGGLYQPELVVQVGTALATSNSATLTVQFQGAADTGSGGSYQPDTWYTTMASPAITAAQGTAGAYLLRAKLPNPMFPANIRPRFYRINFSVLTATNFSAGTISAAFLTFARDDWGIEANAARNYTVL